MPELHLPWIELAIVMPLIGAIVVGLTRNRDVARVRCLGVCVLTFVCAVAEWIDFSSLHTFEAHDHWDLIESVFHRDVFVIDELSAPLLPLVALLYLMTVLSTLRTKVNRWSLKAQSKSIR